MGYHEQNETKRIICLQYFIFIFLKKLNNSFSFLRLTSVMFLNSAIMLLYPCPYSCGKSLLTGLGLRFGHFFTNKQIQGFIVGLYTQADISASYNFRGVYSQRLQFAPAMLNIFLYSFTSVLCLSSKCIPGKRVLKNAG